MTICFIFHLLATKYGDYHPLAILITRRVSHVAAHDLKNQAKNLSVHDAVNAQLNRSPTYSGGYRVLTAAD
jgi:hypothetical protein